MLLAEASMRGLLDLSNKKIKILKKRLEIKEKNNTEPDYSDNSDLKILLSNCYDGCMYAAEIAEVVSRSETDLYYKKAIKFLNDLIKEKDALMKISIMECLFETLADIMNSYLRIYNDYDCYRDTINLDFLDSIANRINNHRKINVLNVDVCSGDEIAKLKECVGNAELYGVSNDKSNTSSVKKAKEHCTKVALGGIHNGKISNEVFDVILNTPPISLDYQENYAYFRINKKEKVYIEENFKFAREDAVIITVLPYFRLTKDMCLMLSKKLDDVSIFKIDSRSDYKNIMIIGRYRKSATCRTEVYDLLRSKYAYDLLDPFIEDDLSALNIVGAFKEVEYFRGGVIDEEELINFIKQGDFTDVLYEEQETEKLSDTTKRPLIPFKIGQIGLVLTSGCLDGVIDEGDGYSHMVKGMVSKQFDTSTVANSVDNTREDTIISSNRVEINLLLPNGDYKTLS